MITGFYEWKKEQSGKQPYLLYAKQPMGKDITNMSKVSKDNYAKGSGWNGPQPIFFAGNIMYYELTFWFY